MKNLVRLIFFTAILFSVFSFSGKKERNENLMMQNKIRSLTITAYNYTPAGIADSAGRKINYTEYDRKGRPVLEISYEFNGTESSDHTVYDSLGRILEIKHFSSRDSSLCRLEQYTCRADGKFQSAKMTNLYSGKLMGTREYEYDSAGNFIRMTEKNEAGVFSWRQEMEYDSAGNMTFAAVYNSMMPKSEPYRMTGWNYDSLGREVRRTTYYKMRTNPIGYTNKFYDQNGLPVKTIRYSQDGKAIAENRFVYTRYE